MLGDNMDAGDKRDAGMLGDNWDAGEGGSQQ